MDVNLGIYSVGKNLVKQNIIFCQIECFVSTSQDDISRENLQAGMTFHLSVMCSTRGFFASKFLARQTLAKFTCSSF